MQICDDGHDEICFEGKDCPLCKATQQIEELEKDNERLQEDIDGLEEELEELKDNEGEVLDSI